MSENNKFLLLQAYDHRSLDWNNASKLTSEQFLSDQLAPADGIVVIHASHDSSDYTNVIYTYSAPMREYAIQHNLMHDSSEFILNTSGGHYTTNMESHVWLPVKKGDYYVCQCSANIIYQALFIPYKLQPVTPPAGCVSYVVETGHNSDNTAFYRKYSDGYIEQWGAVPSRSQTITLPSQFASTLYSIQLTHIDPVGAAYVHEFEINEKNVDSITIKVWDHSGNEVIAAPASGSQLNWNASGY